MTEDFFQTPRDAPLLILCPFQFMGSAGNGMNDIENKMKMLLAVFPMLDYGALVSLKPHMFGIIIDHKLTLSFTQGSAIGWGDNGVVKIAFISLAVSYGLHL